MWPKQSGCSSSHRARVVSRLRYSPQRARSELISIRFSRVQPATEAHLQLARETNRAKLRSPATRAHPRLACKTFARSLATHKWGGADAGERAPKCHAERRSPEASPAATRRAYSGDLTASPPQDEACLFWPYHLVHARKRRACRHERTQSN
jgi:hypothetical protein